MTFEEEPAGTSREQWDNAEYDEPYTWGRPLNTYLAPHQIVRLAILRSKLGESRCRAEAA